MNKHLTIEQQIAALQAQVARKAELIGAVEGDLLILRTANGKAINAKNAADELGGVKTDIWGSVKNVMWHIANNVAAPEREQAFVDVMAEFLTAGTDTAGKSLKLTTVGQYASTGKKVLTELVTKQGMTEEQLSGGYNDVRKLFKSAAELALVARAGEISKQLRFIIKHDKNAAETLEALEEAVQTFYNPLKAAKDATTQAAKADREIRDGVQQQPTAPTVVETVAAEIADIGEVQEEEAAPALVAVNG